MKKIVSFLMLLGSFFFAFSVSASTGVQKTEIKLEKEKTQLTDLEIIEQLKKSIDPTYIDIENTGHSTF